MCQYKTISADSHINEPPDLFERLPQHLKEIGPKLISVERGDAWVMYPGANPRLVSTSAVAGKKPEDYFKEPVTYATMRPGSYEPGARLEDMDLDGIEVDVLFPGIMRLVGMLPNPDVRLAACKAYNDWMAEFCSYNPKRLLGLGIVAVEDGDGAIEELRRIGKLGLRSAVLFQSEGGKPLNHPDLERFWSTAEELHMPINMHTGTSAFSNRTSGSGREATAYDKVPGTQEAFLTTNRLSIATDLTAMVFGGVFDRHSDLKVVSVESDIGWIPWVVDRAENVYDRHRFYLNSPLKRRPSEYFHDHVYATFQQDHPGLMLRNVIGVDNIMWAADYPHTDTTWPYSQKIIEEYFASISPEERHKIVAENAARLYGLI